MEEDKLREIAKEEMEKAIMKNIDSSLIFAYVKKLEEENENLKQAIKINQDLYETKCNENKELEDKMKIREHNYQVAIAETINKYEVKEKIEELKTKKKEYGFGSLESIIFLNKIQVLQELLKEE